MKKQKKEIKAWAYINEEWKKKIVFNGLEEGDLEASDGLAIYWTKREAMKSTVNIPPNAKFKLIPIKITY